MTGGEDAGCRLVHAESGKLVAALGGHSDSVESVAICDCLPVAASASMDGQIIIWDLNSHQPRLTLRHDDGVTQVQFLRDSPLLLSASVDRTLRLWDVRSGDCQRIFQGHQDMILSFGVAQDLTVAVTGGEDGVALVFPIQQQ